MKGVTVSPCSTARPPSVAALSVALLLWATVPLSAGLCTAGQPTIFWAPAPGTEPRPTNCDGGGIRCYEAESLGRFVRLANPSCDPRIQGCTVQVGVRFKLPGIEDMVAELGLSAAPTPLIEWFVKSSGTSIGGCGGDATGGKIGEDFMDTFLEFGGETCDTLKDPSVPLKVVARVCPTSTIGACRFVTTEDQGVFLTGQADAERLGCPSPPLVKDCPTSACGACVQGVPVDGGGAQVNESTGSPALGGGAFLRYAAGGAGRMDTPGATEWRTTLGRFWSHSYAERIVVDPNDSHVWLITEYASFREFGAKDAGGVYRQVSPSDEYRTLTRTAGGWELRDLEGTVMAFDNSGRWLSTTDRNGNAKTASYDAFGVLEEVSFPDGRTEVFGYHADGKLESITEVGVSGADSLTWSYLWNGDDLTRIDRPDGTSIELLYEDPSHPGYLTQQILIGISGGRRIERAWKYDSPGNVIATWEGSVMAGPNGPEPPAGAVRLWQFSYDDPALPSETTVTDPLGNPAVYVYGRDPASRKPRVTSISGDCPTCGSGPNASFKYEDSNNPLRVTEEIDGLGHRTVFEYDANGRMTLRIEAVDTPALTRETTWAYDSTFPALPTRIERPSVAGSPGLRVTTFTYDGAGNLLDRTEQGIEDGMPFTLTTTTAYEPTGQVTDVDPPGFGTDDVTSFTYNPTRGPRGGVIVETRTDPLIGTTTFDYDPFNRRTSVVDPNGVETTTGYDDLDRVTAVTQEGAIDPEDLVTTNVFTEFGDLFRTVLPRGNVIEYAYDAAGRLISIERKPDAATPGERTVFELDAAGNRIREEMQVWGGVAWVTESETVFEYPTRCFLERVVRAPGTPEESVTEFAYDCDGNLEKVWDENHPRFGPTETTPTQRYTYDALDRLISVTQPWGGAGGGDVVTTYAFDVQDHLVSVTDGEGNETTYIYSDRDLLTQESSSVSGTTTFGYNEHGELVTTTDARGVTTTRHVDELDRVTAVRYPTTTLDIAYTYDDPAVPFSRGRLTAITRHGQSVDYRYDRFGRITRDGDLTHDYDANGNRREIGYPGGVTATYGYDFADRQETLDVQVGADPVQALVTGSSYLPSGPLTSLALGNGATETRAFDERHVPKAIVLDAPTPRRWDYTTDGVGNILEIESLIGCSEADLVLANQSVTGVESFTTCAGIEAGPAFSVETGGSATFTAGTRVSLGSGFSVKDGGSFVAGIDPAVSPEVETRSYSYQDVQYFLTGGDGPWGSLAWTYDRIGNRLSEIRDGVTDTYTYLTNTGGGNTAILDQITLGVGGTRDYQFGAAGQLEQVTAGANEVVFTSDDEGRLADLSRPVAGAAVDVLYDGRSFMLSTADPATGALTEPTYSSEGLLHALRRQETPASPEQHFTYLYFAGRPVAQLELNGSGGQTLLYLITDHLGTPVVALDETGTEIWDSAFEPFGRDAEEATPDGALANEVFLRFPGQWEDGRWAGAAMGAEVSYNVHRWYLAHIARYARADPLGILAGDENLYEYVSSNPIRFTDILALVRFKNFPKEREADAKEAVDRVRHAFKQRPCCAGSDARAERWLEYLDDPGFTIVFKPNLKNCGTTPFLTMIGARRRVLVGPKAWNCCPGGKPGVNSLASTIMHEIGHAADGTFRHPWDAEKRCFQCSPTVQKEAP